MARLKTMVEREDGWCDEVTPVMKGYRMACCDCGLVHDMQFRAVRVKKFNDDGAWIGDWLDPNKYRIAFRARRNNRSTAQVRRWKK